MKIPCPEQFHIGHVYSMKIEGIPAFYNCCQLYRDDEILADDHGYCYEKHPYGTALAASEMAELISGRPFDWGEEKRPEISFSDAVFYGLHVRGFTRDTSSGVRHKGTFQGVMEKLDYLKELGITSLLLMPAYEFIEREKVAAASSGSEPTLNYWGYKKGYYYAPKASYAAGKDPCGEMKQLVKACHERGMELFMQFYFPYEVKEPEILNILEYWAMEYHVDGFQIMAGHINIRIIKEAPLLADTKLIFVDFPDEQPGPKAEDALKKRLCVYLGNTRNDYRSFLKGQENTLPAAMYHFRKNGHTVAYLNSIADYDGFRVADMVSYDFKHNEANGEENRDGTDYNFSWNCGEEGPSKKKGVSALRLRQMKNAMLLIFLSQGTPYLFMGDEFGSSQQGNNNPYNQDNKISWVNWKAQQTNQEYFDFVKALIAYRKQHKILHMDSVLSGSDILGHGYPDISFHGTEAYKPDTEPFRRAFGVMLCGRYASDGTEKMIYVAFNMHREARAFALPSLQKGGKWELVLQSGTEEADFETKEVTETRRRKKKVVVKQTAVKAPPHTILVLEA